MSRVLLVLLCALAAATFGNRTAHADDASDCRRQAVERRVAACSRLIAKGSLSNRERAQAYANRGRGETGREAATRAAADFAEAMRLHPDPSAKMHFKALGEIALSQRREAITTLNEAIRLDPRNADAYNTRGNTYRSFGQYDQSIADFDQAIALDPTMALAYYNRGRTHSSKGDHDRAIIDFDKAISLEPEYPNALRLRGLAKIEKGELDAEIADLDATLRLEPDSAWAYNARGYAFNQKRDRERAFADFEAAVRLDPKLATAYSNRGLIHFSRGDKAAAMADFEKVLALPAPSSQDKQRQELARERLARLKNPLAALPGTSGGPKRVALVIGNSQYAGASLLANPGNDAKALAAALRRLGFGLVIEAHNATREQMAQRAERPRRRRAGRRMGGGVLCRPRHRGQRHDVPGPCRCPVEARYPHRGRGDLAWPRARRRWTLPRSSASSSSIPAATIRSPPAWCVRPVRRAPALTPGLAPVEPEGNVLVAYAAKHGTTAEDGQGTHSPFTEALLAHIEEPELEVNFLFRKVRDTVRSKTAKRQEPFLYGSLGSEAMFFKVASAR